MSDTVTLTTEEYEALKANGNMAEVPVKMVSIPELELKKLKGERDLLSARCRELEGLLKREQRDHQEEYNQLLKRVTGAPG